MLLEVLSLAFSIIALIVSIPALSGIILYHFYTPKLEVFFPPHTSEIVYLNLEDTQREIVLNIRNEDRRELIIQIEFILDKPWKLTDGRIIIESGLKSGYPQKGGFYFKTDTFRIPSNSIMGLRFPFEIKLEKCSVDIIVYPKIHLSEFGFPRYFGEVDLKPIRKHFKFVPEGRGCQDKHLQ